MKEEAPVQTLCRGAGPIGTWAMALHTGLWQLSRRKRVKRKGDLDASVSLTSASVHKRYLQSVGAT